MWEVPGFKIYWACLLLSKLYADKEDVVCEIEVSIPTAPLDKYR